MTLAHSRLTSQGQISVPAGVRRKLGIGAGSVIEWQEVGGRVYVCKAARFSSADVHAALFGDDPIRTRNPDVKQGIRAYMRKRHARR